jgi:broad specificity phosphatase PhoE
LIWIRHAEPDAAMSGRCYGHLDIALSDAGRAHAESIAHLVVNEAPCAIYSSSSRRAVETAQPLAAALHQSIKIRDSLREIDFGSFEGLSYDEIAARYPEAWVDWMATPTAVRFPGGESYPILAKRTRDEAARLLAAHPRQSIAIVSHSGPMRVVLADALRIAESDLFTIELPYGAIRVVDHSVIGEG